MSMCYNTADFGNMAFYLSVTISGYHKTGNLFNAYSLYSFILDELVGFGTYIPYRYLFSVITGRNRLGSPKQSRKNRLRDPGSAIDRGNRNSVR